MLSVASVIVVTAFPLVLKRTPHQAAWWGGILLLLSMIAFIGAFLLSGYVTVAYKAPSPGCGILLCGDGGIECTTTTIIPSEGELFGVFVLDDNMAAINNLVPAGGDVNVDPVVCLHYNDSLATSAETVTLLATTPSCPGEQAANTSVELNKVLQSCPAVRELLDNPYIQAQVVCGGYASFFALPKTNFDPYTFAISINASDLNNYTSLTESYEASPWTYITDIIRPYLPANSSLKSFIELKYQCQGGDISRFSTLCDTYEGYSVSKTGQYLTRATAATAGAVVFPTDKISKQLAITIEALSGFFGLVLLVIIGYLIKSKIK